MKKNKVNLKKFFYEKSDELCLEKVNFLTEDYQCEICPPVNITLTEGKRLKLQGKSSPVAVIPGSLVDHIIGLPREKRRAFFKRLKKKAVKVLIVCRPHRSVHEHDFQEEAGTHGISVMYSKLSSGDFCRTLTEELIDSQAKGVTIHGVLIDVFGVGVLILGPSGIGKSEVALELITRGARLVSDDAIDVVRRNEGSIYGTSPSITRYHMEIRGLGIINIKDLFGVAAVKQRKRIELVVEMLPWGEYEGGDVGWSEEYTEILGVKLPLLRLPVAPGRNMATLVEIAARNYLLKKTGVYSGEDFEQKLSRRIEYNSIKGKN